MDKDRLSVAKVIFCSEPKDYEFYNLLNLRWLLKHQPCKNIILCVKIIKVIER